MISLRGQVSLSSTARGLLVVPRTVQVFCFVGPSRWNRLELLSVAAPQFLKLLKTFLFVSYSTNPVWERCN